MLQPFDLILDHQLAALQLDNLQVVGGKVHDRFVQLILENLVLAFKCNKIRLECHAKSPRWLNLRFDPDEGVYTRRRICPWVPRIAPVIFSDLSVTKREYGNPVSLRTGLAGTIFTAGLEHDPEKRVAVFRKDHDRIKQPERDDYSKKSHHALRIIRSQPHHAFS